jgi:hypothetical protein
MRTLTDHETEIVDLALEIVGEGYTTHDAATFALSALPDPDPSFVTFLQNTH